MQICCDRTSRILPMGRNADKVLSRLRSELCWINWIRDKRLRQRTSINAHSERDRTGQT